MAVKPAPAESIGVHACTETGTTIANALREIIKWVTWEVAWKKNKQPQYPDLKRLHWIAFALVQSIIIAVRSGGEFC